MSTITEVIENLMDIYNDGVEKENAKGFAEKFKTASKMLLEDIYNNAETKFTVEDIEYLDGYFIFGTGDNSVVHYHIKETPGWKYGIWFDIDENNKDVITYEWFAQYEKSIDKFKPSASIISYDGNITEFDRAVKNNVVTNGWKIANQIDFIMKHPELAFYRDVHFVDFNTEYVSEEMAKKYFEEYNYKHDLEKQLTKQADEEVINYLKNNILCFYKNAEIIDKGENWSPRYEIIMPYQDNDEIDEPGNYDLLLDDDEQEWYDGIINKWKKEFSEKLDSTYYTPLYLNILAYDKDKLEKD